MNVCAEGLGVLGAGADGMAGSFKLRGWIQGHIKVGTPHVILVRSGARRCHEATSITAGGVPQQGAFSAPCVWNQTGNGADELETCATGLWTADRHMHRSLLSMMRSERSLVAI
eukprot:3557516-Rhodomonas_salina.6